VQIKRGFTSRRLEKEKKSGLAVIVGRRLMQLSKNNNNLFFFYLIMLIKIKLSEYFTDGVEYIDIKIKEEDLRDLLRRISRFPNVESVIIPEKRRIIEFFDAEDLELMI